MDNGERVVLVVDDDPGVLRVTEAILRRKGYSPIAAPGPLEALHVSRSFQDAIDLLLTDIVMPEMDGVALAQLILTERPQTRVLLMSGFADAQSRLPLLKKPFLVKDLIEQVSTVIRGPQTPSSEVSADKELWQAKIQARFNPQSAAALRRFLQASRNLLEVTAGIPSDIPSPDGDLLIRRLATEMKRAFETYQTALKKLDRGAADEETEGDAKTEPNRAPG
jgi:CheY-like chemotaxis protein